MGKVGFATPSAPDFSPRLYLLLATRTTMPEESAMRQRDGDVVIVLLDITRIASMRH
ncbi:MAG: hypothetical protein Q8Q62_11525 [Mesorhizobium sp.]|nr:hypothetical protein [Mesorhizobium sp.]